MTESNEINEQNFFTILPNELFDSGFTLTMFAVMAWLYWRADWKTGQSKWVTAEVVADQMNAIKDGATPTDVVRIRREFQRAMRILEDHGWLTRHHQKGHRGWYWVTIHNYSCKVGALKGQVLNPFKVVPYTEHQAPSVAEASLRRPRGVPEASIIQDPLEPLEPVKSVKPRSNTTPTSKSEILESQQTDVPDINQRARASERVAGASDPSECISIKSSPELIRLRAEFAPLKGTLREYTPLGKRLSEEIAALEMFAAQPTESAILTKAGSRA